MTDTAIPTPPTLAAFPAEAIAALPPEARNTLAGQLIASGFDKNTVEKTLGQASPALGAMPATARPLVAGKETVAMAENLKKHWTGGQAELDAALKAAGLDAVNDPRTGAEKTFDAGFAPPDNIADYRLNFVGRPPADPRDLAALQAEFSGMFAAMQLPAALGQGMLDGMLDSAARYGKLNGVAKSLYERDQEVLTARIGADIGDLDTIRKYAAHALRRADKGVVESLAKKGSLESAAVVIQLALHGQRMVYRERLARQRGSKN